MRYGNWVKKFQPVQNHLSANTAIDGYVFLPGRDLNFVKQQPRDRIWSFIVCDEGRHSVWLISEGFHVANLMGYLLTRKPFDPSTIYTVRY
jgi:hypothetical protein